MAGSVESQAGTEAGRSLAMRMNWRKFLLALFAVILGFGAVLPLVVDWACGCLFRYLAPMAIGETSRWPFYTANGMFYILCGIVGSLLAKRRGRRPWVWALVCVPFSFFAVCYLYALESSGVERTLADNLNSAPL